MTFARGIDISEYNPWVTRPLLADWRSRYPGMCYGQIRSSIGTRTDKLVRQHRESLLAEGYLTGIYHALHEADPMPDQARKMIGLRDTRDTLPNWADIERAGLTEQMVAQWCDAYDDLTDTPLWIYTSKTTFERTIKLNFGRYAKYGLVVADYGPGTLTDEPWPTPPGRPLIPKPWIFQAPPHYELWQYAGDNGRLYGSPMGIDLSQSHSTEAEFRNWFAQEPIPVDDKLEGEIFAHATAILKAL